MKINKLLQLFLLSMFIFLFNVNIVKAKEITCEYEMYPVMYDIAGGKPVPSSKKIGTETYSTLARIVYKGTDKKNYTITSKSKFGFTEKHPNIKDKDIAKYIEKEGKCPSYIQRKSSDNVSVVKDEDKFLKLVNTFTGNTNDENYPLVLVKQNGKATKDSDKVIDNAVNHWNKMKTGDYSDNENLMQYEKVFQSSVKSSSIYKSVISKNSKWSNYLQAQTDSVTLESKEQLQKNASSDNCYYYCPSVHCKNQQEGTPKEQCISSCKNNIKPKCDQAYDSCKGIHDQSAYNGCVKDALSKNGLDSNYVTVRSQEMAELAKEIEKLKKSVKTNTATKVKIEFKPYKLTCDDVKIFHTIWVMIIIIAPALVIVMGTLDFGLAVVSSNEDKMQKAWKKFPKRILALVILILVPTLISLLLSLATNEGARDTNLMYCIINGGE